MLKLTLVSVPPQVCVSPSLSLTHKHTGHCCHSFGVCVEGSNSSVVFTFDIFYKHQVAVELQTCIGYHYDSFDPQKMT